MVEFQGWVAIWCDWLESEGKVWSLTERDDKQHTKETFGRLEASLNTYWEHKAPETETSAGRNKNKASGTSGEKRHKVNGLLSLWKYDDKQGQRGIGVRWKSRGYMPPEPKLGGFFPLERDLIAEDFASHSSFRNSRNHKQASSLRENCSVGIIWYYEVFEIRSGLILKNFVCEEDFNVKSGFSRQPMIIWEKCDLFPSPCKCFRCRILDNPFYSVKQ